MELKHQSQELKLSYSGHQTIFILLMYHLYFFLSSTWYSLFVVPVDDGDDGDDGIGGGGGDEDADGSGSIIDEDDDANSLFVFVN